MSNSFLGPFFQNPICEYEEFPSPDPSPHPKSNPPFLILTSGVFVCLIAFKPAHLFPKLLFMGTLLRRTFLGSFPPVISSLPRFVREISVLSFYPFSPFPYSSLSGASDSVTMSSHRNPTFPLTPSFPSLNRLACSAPPSSPR